MLVPVAVKPNPWHEGPVEPTLAPVTTATSEEGLHARLRRGLVEATRRRDATARAAIRSALGVLDNATAIDVGPIDDGPVDARTAASSAHLAGTTAGVGSAEARRREVSDAEARALLAADVDERREAVALADGAGRDDVALRLRAELAVLESFLADTT